MQFIGSDNKQNGDSCTSSAFTVGNLLCELMGQTPVWMVTRCRLSIEVRWIIRNVEWQPRTATMQWRQSTVPPVADVIGWIKMYIIRNWCNTPCTTIILWILSSNASGKLTLLYSPVKLPMLTALTKFNPFLFPYPLVASKFRHEQGARVQGIQQMITSPTQRLKPRSRWFIGALPVNLTAPLASLYNWDTSEDGITQV